MSYGERDIQIHLSDFCDRIFQSLVCLTPKAKATVRLSKFWVGPKGLLHVLEKRGTFAVTITRTVTPSRSLLL
jgi:hypothetical protein